MNIIQYGSTILYIPNNETVKFARDENGSTQSYVVNVDELFEILENNIPL